MGLSLLIMSVIPIIENALANDVFPQVISVLEQVLGVDLKIIRIQSTPEDEKYEKTYGIHSGGAEIEVGVVRGVLATSEDFITYGHLKTTPPETAYFYTTSLNMIKVGDILKYERTDGTIRKWKVVSRESVGYSRVVVERFRLSKV